MNSKGLIAALKPLECRHVEVYVNDAKVYTLTVHEIIHLTPDLRINPDVGNVMLYSGTYDQCGYPEGVTFWARDMEEILWVDDNTCMLSAKDGGFALFIIRYSNLYDLRGKDA